MNVRERYVRSSVAKFAHFSMSARVFVGIRCGPPGTYFTTVATSTDFCILGLKDLHI